MSALRQPIPPPPPASTAVSPRARRLQNIGPKPPNNCPRKVEPAQRSRKRRPPPLNIRDGAGPFPLAYKDDDLDCFAAASVTATKAKRPPSPDSKRNDECDNNDDGRFMDDIPTLPDLFVDYDREDFCCCRGLLREGTGYFISSFARSPMVILTALVSPLAVQLARSDSVCSFNPVTGHSSGVDGQICSTGGITPETSLPWNHTLWMSVNGTACETVIAFGINAGASGLDIGTGEEANTHHCKHSVLPSVTFTLTFAFISSAHTRAL